LASSLLNTFLSLFFRSLNFFSVKKGPPFIVPRVFTLEPFPSLSSTFPSLALHLSYSESVSCYFVFQRPLNRVIQSNPPWSRDCSSKPFPCYPLPLSFSKKSPDYSPFLPEVVARPSSFACLHRPLNHDRTFLSLPQLGFPVFFFFSTIEIYNASVWSKSHRLPTPSLGIFRADLNRLLLSIFSFSINSLLLLESPTHFLVTSPLDV